MQLRSRRTVAIATSAAVLAGGGAVAVAKATHSGSSSTSAQPDASSLIASTSRASLGKDAFLDDVAKRLGIERSKLDSALEAIAIDEVDWAVDAGFLSKDQGDLIKQRIRSGDGHVGHLGFGLGFGHFGGGVGANGFLAAAQYLGLSVVQLENALETTTLAQVAKSQGKSLDGLKKALRDATKEELDNARTDGFLTQKQEDALLDRFDSTVDDVVNGRSPIVTQLAKQLDIDRTKVAAAIKGAKIDEVDQALAQGLITKDQADALKKRIESSPRELGFGGPGFRGPGFGEPGFGGPGFDGPGHGGPFGGPGHLRGGFAPFGLASADRGRATSVHFW